MKKRYFKCDFGYLVRQTKKEIIKTIIYFAIPVAIFIFGIITTMMRTPDDISWLTARYNILTLAAVLGLLPASRQLISMLMFIKNKKYHLDDDKYGRICEVNVNDLRIRYDLFMTSYDKTYPVLSMIMADDVLLGYTEKKDFAYEDFYKHIKSMLAKNGLKAGSVKVFDDFEKYLGRIRVYNENNIVQTDKDREVMRLMENLSL